MKINNFWKLVIAIGIPQLVGIAGSLFTIRAIPTWYAGLIQPTFAPPNWVFGPVWTLLYLFMGIAAWLIWKRGLGDSGIKRALIIFDVQLVLNALWAVIFFGLHSPGSAFIEIILLWLAILATIFLFYKISKLAMWLLVPYILWVSFAAYLNYQIWMLN